MSLFRKTGPRFAGEAVILLAVPLTTGALGGSKLWIAGLTFLTWLAIAVLERSVARPPEPAVAGLPSPAFEEAPHVRVLAPAGEPPEPVAAEPEPEPEPEPVPQPPAIEPEPELEPVAAAAPGPPRQWNLWNLERVQRDQAADDEELHYLLVYLREFANPDGLLPPDFDALVRESFGSLLAATP